MHALAQHVAHVSEHEEVAEQCAAQRGGIVGDTRDEAARETNRLMPQRGGVRRRSLDRIGQWRIDRHVPFGGKREEALSKADVDRLRALL